MPKYSPMTILVFITHDVQTFVKELNKKIKEYASGLSNRKWVLTPNPSNNRKRSSFCKKIDIVSQPPLLFNETFRSLPFYWKHFGIILESRLFFEDHLRVLPNKGKQVIYNTCLVSMHAVRGTSKEI